jgi:hypothetical protein
MNAAQNESSAMFHKESSKHANPDSNMLQTHKSMLQWQPAKANYRTLQPQKNATSSNAPINSGYSNRKLSRKE